MNSEFDNNDHQDLIVPTDDMTPPTANKPTKHLSRKDEDDEEELEEVLNDENVEVEDEKPKTTRKPSKPVEEEEEEEEDEEEEEEEEEKQAPVPAQTQISPKKSAHNIASRSYETLERNREIIKRRNASLADEIEKKEEDEEEEEEEDEEEEQAPAPAPVPATTPAKKKGGFMKKDGSEPAKKKPVVRDEKAAKFVSHLVSTITSDRMAALNHGDNDTDREQAVAVFAAGADKLLNDILSKNYQEIAPKSADMRETLCQGLLNIIMGSYGEIEDDLLSVLQDNFSIDPTIYSSGNVPINDRFKKYGKLIALLGEITLKTSNQVSDEYKTKGIGLGPQKLQFLAGLEMCNMYAEVVPHLQACMEYRNAPTDKTQEAADLIPRLMSNDGKVEIVKQASEIEGLVALIDQLTSEYEKLRGSGTARSYTKLNDLRRKIGALISAMRREYDLSSILHEVSLSEAQKSILTQLLEGDDDGDKPKEQIILCPETRKKTEEDVAKAIENEARKKALAARKKAAEKKKKEKAVEKKPAADKKKKVAATAAPKKGRAVASKTGLVDEDDDEVVKPKSAKSKATTPKKAVKRVRDEEEEEEEEEVEEEVKPKAKAAPKKRKTQVEEEKPKAKAAPRKPVKRVREEEEEEEEVEEIEEEAPKPKASKKAAVVEKKKKRNDDDDDVVPVVASRGKGKAAVPITKWDD